MFHSHAELIPFFRHCMILEQTTGKQNFPKTVLKILLWPIPVATSNYPNKRLMGHIARLSIMLRTEMKNHSVLLSEMF